MDNNINILGSGNMLEVCPYIILNGNTQEAVKFYQDVLDAELIGIQTYGDFPEDPEFPFPEEIKKLVADAQLKIGETYLMFSDNFPNEPYQLGDQVNIGLLIKEVPKTKEVYEKLKIGGNVLVELNETPFSPAYAQIKDRFGITWQISTNVE